VRVGFTSVQYQSDETASSLQNLSNNSLRTPQRKSRRIRCCANAKNPIYQQKLAELEALKKSLLHQTFSGQL
jgi:hypothetical protein